MTTTHTTTTDQAFSQPLLIDVWQDPDTESPNDHDGLFRLVSFSNRHLGYEDPERVLSCQFEVNDNEWAGICELWPHASTGELGEGNPEHEYQPPEPIAAVLSYYEHGGCEWSRSGNGPADYGGFDTVSFAGVLILCEGYRPGDQFGEWWTDKTDDERTEAIDGFLAEYNAWANGETYGYTISEQAGECPSCHRTNDPEMVDSCGGHIGGEWLAGSIREALVGLWGLDDAAQLVAGTHFTVAANDYAWDNDDVLRGVYVWPNRHISPT